MHTGVPIVVVCAKTHHQARDLPHIYLDGLLAVLFYVIYETPVCTVDNS